jgi:tetratricopeptide (TPR) repeat protein
MYLTGRIRGGIGWFIGAAAAFLFGLWAKETGIAALLALPALDLVPLGLSLPVAAAAAAGKDADARRAKGRSVGRAVPSAAGGRTAPWTWRYGPFAAATIIYWFMRYSDLHRGVRGNESFSTLLFSTQLQAQKDKLFEMVLDLVGAIGFYVRKVTVPTNLNAFVADVPHDALTIIVGLAAIAGGVGLFLLARRKGARMIPALAALFFATIAPSFAIAMFDISEAPVAERYLYIPSIAACLGAGWLGGLLIEKVRERTGPAAARGALVAIATAGVAVFSAFAWSTSIRNETWHDDILFWQDAVSKAPHQGLPHLHLGLANDKLPWSSPEERKKLDDIAEREYLLALNPKIIYDVEGRSTALNNLGNVYMDQGRYDKGEECFRNSFGMRPSYPTPYYGMGLLMYRRALDSQKAGNGEQAWKQMTESRDWIDQALNRNPRYVKAFLMGGTVRFALRDEGGVKYLQQVMSLAPGTAEAAQAEKLIARERTNRAAREKTPETPGGTGATAPGGVR